MEDAQRRWRARVEDEIMRHRQNGKTPAHEPQDEQQWQALYAALPSSLYASWYVLTGERRDYAGERSQQILYPAPAPASTSDMQRMLVAGDPAPDGYRLSAFGMDTCCVCDRATSYAIATPEGELLPYCGPCAREYVHEFPEDVAFTYVRPAEEVTPVQR